MADVEEGDAADAPQVCIIYFVSKTRKPTQKIVEDLSLCLSDHFIRYTLFTLTFNIPLTSHSSSLIGGCKGFCRW